MLRSYVACMVTQNPSPSTSTYRVPGIHIESHWPTAVGKCFHTLPPKAVHKSFGRRVGPFPKVGVATLHNRFVYLDGNGRERYFDYFIQTTPVQPRCDSYSFLHSFLPFHPRVSLPPPTPAPLSFSHTHTQRERGRERARERERERERHRQTDRD